MPFRTRWRLAWRNTQRNPRDVIAAILGVALGTAMFSFFMGLGTGVQEGVLNRMYPNRWVQLEPAQIELMGIRRPVVDVPLDAGRLDAVRALPGVEAAYPRQRSRFQARLWGGEAVFGRPLHAEAFLDGMDPAALVDPKGGLPGDDPWLQRFRDWDEQVPCEESEDCVPGAMCLAGVCRESPCDQESPQKCGVEERCVGVACLGDATCGGGSCVAGECVSGYCARTCSPADEGRCGAGRWCASEEGETGYCAAIPCAVEELPLRRGRSATSLPGRVTGAWPEEPKGMYSAGRGCPDGSSCVTRSVVDRDGWCEPPLPVLVSPFLIEVFNSTASHVFGVGPIANADRLRGLQFHLRYGDSFLKSGLPAARQTIHRAELVGFTDRAVHLGLTVPLPHVQRTNTRHAGRGGSQALDSVGVVASANEDVATLVEAASALGLAPNAQGAQALEAARMLRLLAWAFGLVSAVIVGVAAIQVAHMLLLVVSRRRREIGVLRAFGASSRDIRWMILVEGAGVGLGGAILGNVLAFLAAALVNQGASVVFAGLVFRPDDLFRFTPSLLLMSVSLGVGACLLGALPPARWAAAMDPVEAIQGGA